MYSEDESFFKIRKSSKEILNENELLRKQLTVFQEMQEKLILNKEQLKRSLKESKYIEARLTSLVDIFQYQNKSFQEILDYALDKAIKLTGSKIGYIYLYNDDKQEFVLNSLSQNTINGSEITTHQSVYTFEEAGILGEVVHHKRSIVENNLHALNPLKRGYPGSSAGLGRLMIIPVFNDEKIVAAVGVANKDANYDDTDIIQFKLLMDAVWKAVQQKLNDKENMEIQSQQLQAKNIPNMESFKLSAAGIAHEIKNILTVIIGYADISMIDLPKGNEIKENLEEILIAAERLKKIAHQLQAISR